jgi:hypothetical protein
MWSYEECVALVVVTREDVYRRSDLVGGPSAAAVVAVRVVRLREERRWYARVQKGERILVVCSVSPETSSVRRWPWPE